MTDLATAFRWLHKRPEVRIVASSGNPKTAYHHLESMPHVMGYSLSGGSGLTPASEG